MLKIGSSFYDPPGLIALIVIQAKVIFQLICKEKINWDAEIPEPIATLWKKFLSHLKQIKCVKIPRYIFTGNEQRMQVHGFCGASEKAYCCVVYVRVETVNGVRVQLVTAKTKVAPLKKVTIPRLELLSCLLLAKVLSSISDILREKLKGAPITCWNDSSSALGWIRGEDKRWSPWVEERAKKVRAIVEAALWRHLPGSLNPADIATRTISPEDVNSDSKWLTAPAFLYEDPNKWPVTPVDENITLELKGAPVIANVAVSSEPVIDTEKYSSLYRQYRVTVSCSCFCLSF